MTDRPMPWAVVSHWPQAKPKPNGSPDAVPIALLIWPRRFASSAALVTAQARVVPADRAVQLVVGERADVIQVQRVGVGGRAVPIHCLAQRAASAR